MRKRTRPARLRTIWNGMKARCFCETSAIFRYYGGRGITVCPEWANDSGAFIDWAMKNGYEDTLTLDRIDNDKGYEPGNCRWVGMKEQGLNRRSAVMVTAFGETKNRSLWGEDPRAVVGALRIARRLEKGWHPEDAITTPVRSKGAREVAARERIASDSDRFSATEIASETWKPIPISVGYEASDLGRIRSYWARGNSLNRMRETPVLLNPRREPDGRLAASIMVDGKRKTIRVPTLVLMAHVGPPEAGQQACHFPDPNPGNCRLANLYWGSRAENGRDRTRLRKILFDPPSEP